MDKKKLLKMGIVAAAVLIFVGIILWFSPFNEKSYVINMTTESSVSEKDVFQLYYLTENDAEGSYLEQKSLGYDVFANKTNELQFVLPGNTREIRLDLGSVAGNIKIESLVISCGSVTSEIIYDVFTQYTDKNGIANIRQEGNAILVESESNDPYLVWDIENLIDSAEAAKEVNMLNGFAKALACIAEVLFVAFVLKRYNELVEFPVQIYQSKKLIMQLAKNDFKTKYAGSYLGIVWAFIQPVVTILVYWFVFDVGLRSGDVMEAPFILWLIAGLVPWFFFSDAWNGGTGALIEYQYLVKKVVFQIDILPLVRVLSAMFVHAFFVTFTVILHACYGYTPDLYTLQIFYYSFCVFVLVLGLSYITSAVVGFFKDLTQIINIILQVGVWMTPIMWNMDGMGLPGWLSAILKLNPMYYVVSGYRNALIHKVWFWENPSLTIYFWGVTLFILVVGALIFKKLKIHFADVL